MRVYRHLILAKCKKVTFSACVGVTLGYDGDMRENFKTESEVELVCPVTHGGLGQLYSLDSSFIGTSDYMGIAYFWSREYCHDLRDASPIDRVSVHRSFLEFDLPLDGASDLHQELIDIALGNFTIAE